MYKRQELGLTVCNLEELIGGTPEENAQITRNILSGSLKGPKRDVVVLNAAISLYLGIDDCTVRDCVKTCLLYTSNVGKYETCMCIQCIM